MRHEIKTERLVLRQLTLDDAKSLSYLAGDYDISRMTASFPHPFPLLSAEFKIMELIQKRRRNLAYPYAITEDGGKLIGMADLFRRDADAALEIGYWLGKPYWGKGYVTEACQALINEARHNLGIKRIMAGIFGDNSASINVLEKLGFKLSKTDDSCFSMARMERAKGMNMALDFDAIDNGDPLQDT